jgi:hypothetical protein
MMQSPMWSSLTTDRRIIAPEYRPAGHQQLGRLASIAKSFWFFDR